VGQFEIIRLSLTSSLICKNPNKFGVSQVLSGYKTQAGTVAKRLTIPSFSSI
jgi:hypothetical protein